MEIARSNAADPLTWNSAATADHFTADAVRYETIDISEFKGNLVAGTNVLAFQMFEYFGGRRQYAAACRS